MLRNYLEHYWTSNQAGFLFPNRRGTHPRWRDNVVKYGLKPILKQLGIPNTKTGLHAFRHGLATELAESAVPIPAVIAANAPRGCADDAVSLRPCHPGNPTERDGKACNCYIGANWPTNVNINCFVSRVGGSVWESNPPFLPRREGSPSLKFGRITGPLALPHGLWSGPHCDSISYRTSHPQCSWLVQPG